jgi:hypothetical protein
MAIVAVFTALSLAGCPTEVEKTVEVEKIVELEKPTSKSSPHEPVFADKTVTFVTGDEFTKEQWNDIVSAIVNKFATAYNEGSDIRKGVYEEVFDSSEGITIIVEKNPQGYTNYKTTRPIVYVRADGLDNLNTNNVIMAFVNGRTGDTYIDGVRNPDPTAADFDISGTGTHKYDGSPKTVTITAKADKSTGAITIRYTLSNYPYYSAPSAVGTYTITFDIKSTDSWNRASYLSAGTLTIEE